MQVVQGILGKKRMLKGMINLYFFRTEISETAETTLCPMPFSPLRQNLRLCVNRNCHWPEINIYKIEKQWCAEVQ